VYTEPKSVELRDVPKPEAKEGYSVIKVAYAGVCGSDLTIYAGAHPRAQAPLVLGHELSGILETDHPSIPKGSPVTCNPLISCGHCAACKSGKAHICATLKLDGIDCDGGLAEYMSIPHSHVVPIPEGVDMKLGAFIEPLAVGVHAVREGRYVPGDSAVVLGCGPIGLVCAVVLRRYGCENLTIVDTNDNRLAVAREIGFATLNPQADNVQDEVRNRTKGAGADFVFDCAGHPSVAPLLTELLKPYGVMVGVASYKAKPEINMTMCMFKELQFRFVRVYTAADFEIASRMIKQEKASCEKIISHVLKPEEYQHGFDMLTSQSNALKVLFSFA